MFPYILKFYEKLNAGFQSSDVPDEIKARPALQDNEMEVWNNAPVLDRSSFELPTQRTAAPSAASKLGTSALQSYEMKAYPHPAYKRVL